MTTTETPGLDLQTAVPNTNQQQARAIIVAVRAAVIGKPNQFIFFAQINKRCGR